MHIKRLLVPALFALPALAQSTAPPTVHAITGNFSADLLGPLDTRPGTYGNADYAVWNQAFQNVPAGCRVQILHISGDFIAYPMGAVPPGTSVGVLAGAYRSSIGGSTRAAYAADGWFFYLQDGSTGNPMRIPINQDVTEGYLDSDNVLNWKVAEYLNTTGQKIYMEITFSQVTFVYVQ